ncbi:MAG: hypothetical protein RBT49_08010 [Bacteroidales bacterium]|jgi:hypothetical protein|nr:hypothetical protein [Bacteroidales bacterium]
MKNKLRIFSLLSAILILMGSCTTEKFYSYDESTARYLSPEISGFVTPTVADLNVSDTRITHVETFQNTLKESDLNNIEESGTVQYFKNFTIAQAVKKYNADVIVAPIFDIKTSEDFSTITITVIGYPANYINFRKATSDDINLVYPCKKESKIIIENPK